MRAERAPMNNPIRLLTRMVTRKWVAPLDNNPHPLVPLVSTLANCTAVPNSNRLTPSFSTDSPYTNIYTLFFTFNYLNMLNTATGSVALIMAPNAKHSCMLNPLCKQYNPNPTITLDNIVAIVANSNIFTM